MAEPIEATRENFDELIESGTVLVDVWGPDCKPCLQLMPHVEKLADKRADELRVVKLEAPKARRACINLGVHGLPTFLLMRDGEEMARLSQSTISPKQLNQWLDENLKTTEEEVS
ncbi:MAG: thioredoxin family protein [Actinomycetota bacterium]|jgi:thioredoxin 1|nr:thioredoxin family protein [Solirubrobacterales bacterium]MBA3840635.1 thioredoxin family protein [Thermoleophilaceae bacterium]MDQ3408921.1 thioredoxin family protein [Actinomycetota bacterium]